MKEQARSLYVHIPFCQKKCLYCDFVSFAGCELQNQEAYLSALLRELDERHKFLEEPLQTLYIGGGTPTALYKGGLEWLVQELQERLTLCENAEITIEANPGTLSLERMNNLKSLGVNRISLGVQSLNDIELQEMGRIHSANEAIKTLHALLELDFSVSADLMCNTPKQTAKSFESSLRQLLVLPINHMSIYDLKVEKNTPFYSMNEEGRLLLPKEPEMESIDNIKRQLIEESHLERYEISNYARRGYHSRHNTVYWKNQPYLGIGVAATSRYDGIRSTNGTSLADYLQADFRQYHFNVTNEKISEKMEREETVFLALRLTAGLDLLEFKNRHGAAFQFYYSEQASQILEMGLGLYEEGHFRLTNKGLDYSNHVLSLFV
ncbi:radical SAM family heme chaperone HemW [Clostridia bacterium]|nr:radical SAM family heme chaperone HemW [Clostridia bacterium]